MELIIGNEYYTNLNEYDNVLAKLVKYDKYSVLMQVNKNFSIETHDYDLFETEEELMNFESELEFQKTVFEDELDKFIDMFEELTERFGDTSYKNEDVVDYLREYHSETDFDILKFRERHEDSISIILRFKMGYLKVEWDGDLTPYNLGLSLVEPYCTDNRVGYRDVFYATEPNRFRNRKIREFEQNYRESRFK